MICFKCKEEILPGTEVLVTSTGEPRKLPVCTPCHEKSVKGLGRGAVKAPKPKQVQPGRSDRQYYGFEN